RPGERLHEVLLSRNESFAAGPAPGLRSVRTTRDPAAFDAVPGVIAELEELVVNGDRERLAQMCLAAAEALQ
ncbi:MAG TPA: hypothetical protein VGQ62_01540, partial [Chloroflexota bacterium]|nr:hypothetical protein [Chloroflexota bacterium]